MAGLAAFRTSACTADVGSPSDRCGHFPGGSGVCVAYDDGRLCLTAQDGGAVDLETATLFAETVAYGLAQVEP